ncbi:MAG: alpha/beta hydrolase family protein [Sphingomonadales bacterium]|jgi:predicted esterase
MQKQFSIICAIALLITFSGCQAKTICGSGKDSIQQQKRLTFERDTIVTVCNLEFFIQVPQKGIQVKGDLLLLPGWDFSNRKWCDSTNVCKTSLQKGFRVIAPQMGRSVYATRYYPQTRKDFRSFPTLPQLDSALELLKANFGIFMRQNLILGLSTGARGVALLCQRKPDWFHAAAALSGDYNQASMPNDNLMRLTYGPYSLHKRIWTETDNPQTDAGKLKTPIYLGHGLKDKVVPFEQTQDFARVLQKKKTNTATVVVNLNKMAGHDFNYWRSELPAIWQFFEKHTK